MDRITPLDNRILPFEYFRSPIDTAWKREFFNSKYPPNSEWDWIDSDQPENAIDDRPITYKFNDYGFRCEQNFDDVCTDFKILVSGCSMTVGVGVAYEHAWPQKFKELVGKMRVFQAVKNAEPWPAAGRDIALYNLAQSSASPDYVVRSIYKTIDLITPDLVVVCWPPETRFEQPSKTHRNKLRDIQMEDNEFPDRYQTPGWPEYQLYKNIEFLDMLCLHKNVPLVHGPGQELTMFGIDPRNGARDHIHPDEQWHEEFAQLCYDTWAKNSNK